MLRHLLRLALPATAALGASAAHAQLASDTAYTPALPRAVPTLPADAGGRVVRVPAGANLQAALDAARGGDRLELAPGAAYRGSFVLRRRAPGDSAWITVAGPLPLARGTRVSPEDAPRMPSLQMVRGNDGVVHAELGAHHYRLVGLELTVTPTTPAFNALVRLSIERDTTAAGLPHHLVIERSYIHGRPDLSLTRCVMANTGSFALVDSYVSDCHTKGSDSQAFLSWGGPGPYLLENNYLEGAGENVMFGGGRARAAWLVPQDITIRRNYFYKPRAWAASKQWSVKNLLELKDAQRVLVEENVLRNVWKDAQTGRALLIRAADQEDPRYPWARTKNITVRRNWIDSTVAPVNINAQGRIEKTSLVRVEQNLMTNATGQAFQLGGNMSDIALVRNTSLADPAVPKAGGVVFDGTMTRFTMVGNVFAQGRYGAKASGTPSGAPTLARRALGRVDGNTWVGVTRAAYPAADRVVTAVAAVPAGAGADRAAVRRAVAGVETGRRER